MEGDGDCWDSYKELITQENVERLHVKRLIRRSDGDFGRKPDKNCNENIVIGRSDVNSM